MVVTNEGAENSQNYGFSIDELYEICSQFMAEKAEKAFHLTFEDRVELSALLLQIKHGKYKESSVSTPGLLDIFGNKRIARWMALGALTSDDAKLAYVNRVHTICPQFSSQLEACHRSSHLKSFDETRQSIKPISHPVDELSTSDLYCKPGLHNEHEIRTALNAQTRDRFQLYAEQQYPSDPIKQSELIANLQDRHFHEYISFIQQRQDVSRDNVSNIPGSSASISSSSDEKQNDQQAIAFAPSEHETSSFIHHDSYGTVRKQSCEIQSFTCNNASPQMPVAPNNCEQYHIPSSTNSPNHNEVMSTQSDASGVPALVRPPNIWTRQDIKEFKLLLADVIDTNVQIGSGDVITIRVPTYPTGTSVFWEFATDDYDIGFGLFFEWASKSSDTEGTDVEKTEASVSTAENSQAALVDELIPVCRRNSHEEVQCGSHIYPGMGTYLFKFDNSYSLWRAKILHYRVFYTC